MSSQYNTGVNIKYQVLVSIAGLVLVVLLTVFPPTVNADFSWRKPLIGLIFSIFCFLGVLAVFSPYQCGKLVNKKIETVGLISNKIVSHDKGIVLRGHHPTCGKYSAHIFRIKNRTFCAACIGLLIGGLLALVIAVGYFFWNWQVIEHITMIVFLGITGVSFGLLQFKFKSFVRLFANTVFVIGTLLILIGIDKTIQNLFFDLFMISLIAFWLFTRISLSQLDHEMICSSCNIENCKIRTKKREELTPPIHGV